MIFPMNRQWVLIGILLLWSNSGFSQNLKHLDSLKTIELIDTLFIDHNINNWSFRIFTNYKEQRFKLSNEDQSLTYFPNNPSGIGIGIATRKLLLDIAFNIKGRNEQPTSRFDMSGTVIIEKHLIDLFFQTYQGFNVRNDFNNSESFREDLKSLSTGINYMYMFNAGEISIAAMKSGLSRQKKTAVSFGLGSFLIISNQSADSSLVPLELVSMFNDKAQLKNFTGIGAGILGGFSTLIVLPANFFLSVNITPGIGLMYKKVETELAEYKPSNPLLYQLQFAGALGYNSDRIYINLTVGNGIYSTDLDFGNKALFSLTKAKLAIGYKLIGR